MLDALDRDDVENLREELGDVLLHIVMQTQMAREEELFRLSDVVAGIYAKSSAATHMSGVTGKLSTAPRSSPIGK